MEDIKSISLDKPSCKKSKRYQKDIDKKRAGEYNQEVKKISNSEEALEMRFLISVPDELHRKLKSVSKRYGKPLTGMIRDILWDWLEGRKE